MKKPSEPMNNPVNSDKQRGFGVVELLFAASTIVAGVVTAALTTTKRPPGYGD
jgi:hypothetical protein